MLAGFAHLTEISFNCPMIFPESAMVISPILSAKRLKKLKFASKEKKELFCVNCG
jgi:hypothetical protein